MRDRERAALRQFRQEQAAIEEAERLERERPLREAEEQLQRTAVELGRLERQNILTMPDDEFHIPASVAGKRMTNEEARRFNAEQSNIFIQENPNYFPCDKNFETIVGYLQRNGISIADAATFKAAHDRLQALGLLEERPVSTPEILPTPAPSEPERPNDPQIFAGYDPKTGLPKNYTSVEVEKMSAEQYRRNFRLWGDNAPRFIDPRF